MKYFDKNRIEIKVGMKVKRTFPVAYAGGKFPDYPISTVIEIDGELYLDELGGVIPLKNVRQTWLEVIQ